MSGRQPFNKLTEKWTEERRRRVAQLTDQLRLELALNELRRRRGFTQEELGQALGVRQPAVARMEKRPDMYVSTLRAVIEALGGELELIARFEDEEVNLKGLGRP